MSRSAGLAHIIRQDDGTSVGVWGVYTIKSAFQPVFAFGGGKLSITAYEGLVRPFRDGEGMSPGVFFKGIPAIDRFHVETLMRTLHILNAARCLDPKASIFVNFDPSLFSDAEIVDVAIRDMRLVLHEARMHPSRIVCEVTEQKSASRGALRRFVAALRASGFRIAVDDYGADDSDIARIDELQPDIVKFDAHWITRLMESGAGFGLLKAMVSKFADRGIETVFEGIEETWQLELAEQSGASMVQGFVLARPEIAPTSFAVFSRGAAQEHLEKLPRAEVKAPAAAPQPRSGGRRAAFGRRVAGK
ncbi:EAL domain-containing protein [Nitratireductor mangrovi]|uniref:EAL domain-containing protein n=1 Tax=Nitratireductor mangrovi TaxID=2599600 RepID=A0A5B8L1Y6_9HYPH|nr:EAL domain-containing protein [Nitratireductor mangrovi]QDZ01975.1 EAL domain-containing protein [Nitratireductor mangrovi]